MVDPTSSLGEDVDEDTAPECATCREKIIDSPTHRVVSYVEDGAVHHRHFCSDACKAEWTED